MDNTPQLKEKTFQEKFTDLMMEEFKIQMSEAIKRGKRAKKINEQLKQT
jgi:hypothetical protein